MVTMLAIIIIVVMIFNKSEENVLPGLTLLEQDGECINAKQIKIFQVIAPNVALADALTIPNEKPYRDDNSTFVLILGDIKTNFYDDQKIDIPKGKCAKQIGTYKYRTNNGMDKTVPAIEIQ